MLFPFRQRETRLSGASSLRATSAGVRSAAVRHCSKAVAKIIPRDLGTVLETPERIIDASRLARNCGLPYCDARLACASDRLVRKIVLQCSESTAHSLASCLASAYAETGWLRNSASGPGRF